MVLIDPIGDMLTRIRNAIQVKFGAVEMPSSRLKVEIARILKEEGYIYNFEVMPKGSKKILKVALKYNSKMKNAINALKRISTPGRHLYVKSSRIPRVQSGFGTVVLSTSKGLMTDKLARQQKVGGEVLFFVW